MNYSDVATSAGVWEKPSRRYASDDAAAGRAAARCRRVARWSRGSRRRSIAPGREAESRRPVLHRLNRAEYANAVRDLLALDVDPSTLLPPDDSAWLRQRRRRARRVAGSSSSFMEAASKVSARWPSGIPTAASRATFSAFVRTRRRTRTSKASHRHGRGILARVTLPLDAEYQLTVKMFRTNLGVTRGLE
jgi:hypothetical protein